MLIFQLLNQYTGIAKAAFFGCSAKLNKSIKTNIIEILLLIMCIPRKINFLQLGRYGSRCEQCYRQTAERPFDWLGFNMNLGARYFHQLGKGFGRLAIAIDPSFLEKAGEMTAHVGRFWSGCASAVKHGLEILAIALVDADIRECIMLRAVQTRNAAELLAASMNLPQWYLSVLKTYASELLKITNVMVADAAFSTRAFADGLKEIGFHLVSRLRSDAVVFYLHCGPRTGKRGRPKKYDGRIDFANPDKSRMTKVAINPADGEAYELVAWSKALNRRIRLVVHYLPNGSHRLYFSTDAEMPGIDVYDIYRTRFQIEFCFRDGHQFTGLLDCQSRDEKTLDFAYNASFAAINITKVMIKEHNLPLSIGRIKSLMVNAHFAKRFFEGCGIDPDPTLNAKLFKELFGYVAKAG